MPHWRPLLDIIHAEFLFALKKKKDWQMMRCGNYFIWHTGYVVHTSAIHFHTTSERNFGYRKRNKWLVVSYFWTFGASVPLFSLRMNPTTRISLRTKKNDEEKHEASPDRYVGLIKYSVNVLHSKSRKETHRLSSAAFLSYFSVTSFHTLKVWNNRAS